MLNFYGGLDSKKIHLDKKLDDLINKDNGTYIELGANDGLKQSNTAFFEFTRKWKGLLIEPSLNAFNLCKVNRPNSVVINYACVSSEYDKDSICGDFNGNLMSSINGTRLNSNNLVSANTITLSNAIDKYLDNADIDLLSLDAEGYEFEILRGLNFAKHKPKYVLIEIYNKDFKTIVDYMINNNYYLHSNLSSYNNIDNPGWDGSHNDYLFVSK